MSESVNLAKATELDPVCGMTVDPSIAKGRAEHAGKTYYFCSAHCVGKFQQDPEQYLHKPGSTAATGLVTLGTSKANAVRPAPAKAKDPVCGMDVDPATAKHRWEHAGKTYYFCCGGCLEKFRSTPDRFLRPQISPGLVQLGSPQPRAPQSAPAAPTETKPATARDQRIYVCPMCPEVRQVGPGPCPSCGMALEPESPLPISKIEYTCPMHPEIVRSGAGQLSHLRDGARAAHRDRPGGRKSRTSRHDAAASGSASRSPSPLLIIAMVDMLPSMPVQHALPPDGCPGSNLSSPPPSSFGAAGHSSSAAGRRSSIARTNMFTLIAMGTGVAYLYSLIATVVPQIFPESFRGHGGRPDVYFEAAAAITTLVLLGQVLELRARSQTSAAIRALLDSEPKDGAAS